MGDSPWPRRPRRLPPLGGLSRLVRASLRLGRDPETSSVRSPPRPSPSPLWRRARPLLRPELGSKVDSVEPVPRPSPELLLPCRSPRPPRRFGVRDLGVAGASDIARRERLGNSRSGTPTFSGDFGTGRPSLNARVMRASNPGLLFLPDRRDSDIKVRMNSTDDGPQLPISRKAAGSFGYRFSASNSPIPVRARLVCQSVRWMPMQSYDQFRESERLTWPVRGGVTALALGAAAYSCDWRTACRRDRGRSGRLRRVLTCREAGGPRSLPFR